MADRDDQQKQLLMDFHNCFNSEGGKRVLGDLKDFVRFDTSVIPLDNNGRTDIYMVMRNEGKRAVIFHIDRMLKKKPGEKKQEQAKS